MNAEITAKIFEYIDAMAAGLGVASTYVFELLVRQQIAEGVALLIAGIILAAGGAWAAVKAFRLFAEDGDSDVQFIAALGGITAGVASLIGLFALIPPAILHLINPEYYALQAILDVIKGG